MGIFLALAPFIAFAIVDRIFGATVGLFAGTATSVVLLIRDWMSPNRKPKVLEIGTFLLFCGMSLYAILGDPVWSVWAVRLRVDAGLLLIVLVTMAIRNPFTLQYAREQTPQNLWSTPEFIRTNYIITAVWAGAFLVLVIADSVLAYRTDLPPRLGIIATILALVGAFKFTQWHPNRNALPAE